MDGIGLKRVSVVVPARDEAHALPGLLASLRPLVGAGGEVIVVDDGSTDGTADVARAGGARVLAAPPPPNGWTGKAAACHLGASKAAGDVLVFLDADVTVEPGGLEAVLGELGRRGGLVSVQPFHDAHRCWWEPLSSLPNLIGMAGADVTTPLAAVRRFGPTGAFGPCMAITRAAYEQIGGHAHPAVRSAIVDDVALARRCRAEGSPVAVFGGRGALRFRMYPLGLQQWIEGWTKNLATGAAGARPLTTLLVVAWLSGLLTVPAHGAPTAAALYVAYAAQLWWALRRIGRYRWAAVLWPVPVLAFLAVFTRSVALTALRRRVTWRGREVDVRR